MRLAKKMFRRVIVLSILFTLASCSTEAPPQDVEKAGVLFFERLKGAEYEAIYDDVSKQFKETVAKETIFDNLKKVTAIGRIQSYNRIKMPFEGDKENRIAAPVYSIYFDREVAEMTLKFIDEDGEWKLIYFEVKQHTSQS
jgi:hypothetical protein